MAFRFYRGKRRNASRRIRGIIRRRRRFLSRIRSARRRLRRARLRRIGYRM